MNGLASITLNWDSRSEIIVSTDDPSKICEIAKRSFKLYFPLNLLTPHLDRRSLVVYKPVDFRKLAIQFLKNQKAVTLYVDFRSLLIESVAKEISNIKFELRQVESKTEENIKFELSQVESETYENALPELGVHLTNLRTRLTKVTAFIERFQDDIWFIKSKITCVEVRFGYHKPKGKWLYCDMWDWRLIYLLRARFKAGRIK